MNSTLIPPSIAQPKLARTYIDKASSARNRTKPTEIVVSPGELVLVLNEDAVDGAIPSCYFTIKDNPAPSTSRIDCTSPCTELNSNPFESVGNAVNHWMVAVKGMRASDILEGSGLLEVAHQPIATLTNEERTRLQILYAVLRGDEVLVFDSPWAQEGMDFFLLDLLRYLRQYHDTSGILPAFVVRDCRDSNSLFILADKVWEIEDGRAMEVEADWR